MPLNDQMLHQVLRTAIFGAKGSLRFTQDSPVLPDVWWAFGTEGDSSATVALLLTPHRRGSTVALVGAVRTQFGPPATLPADLAYNEAYVKGSFTFEDLVCRLLPLTRWYQGYLWRGGAPTPGGRPPLDRDGLRDALLRPPGSERDTDPIPADLVWLVRCAGSIALARQGRFPEHAPWSEAGSADERRDAAIQIVDAFEQLLDRSAFPDPPRPLLWRVNLNRMGSLAVWRSRQTIKADAAERTYDVDCSQLRWAVIDSGIDARHPAFRRRDKTGTLLSEPAPGEPGGSFAERTRVVETYDFTRLAELLAAAQAEPDPAARSEAATAPPPDAERSPEAAALAGQPAAALAADARAELRRGLTSGRMISWDLLQPLLRVADEAYEAPPAQGEHDHGTHVAGILAGDWRKAEQDPPGDHDVPGICPTLELVDIRVLDENGACDEFMLITALQFVRFLNQHADRPVIHGVNISLQFSPDPASYAAGHTPICEECERLVSSGVVVVVAAGNAGFEYRFTDTNPQTPWFIDICIADPGTTDAVITVGSTHRDSPHTYGVSYFSSRGPTPDGRHKPDLVAPGEKITAPVPNKGLMAKDGTSMAAPHVSGAAALLMARNAEYVGRPAEVKRILMETATDLGRERNFQGAGLVDILRAIGSV